MKFINFARCAPTRKTHQSAIQSFGQPGTPMRAVLGGDNDVAADAELRGEADAVPCTCAIVGFGTSRSRSIRSWSPVTPRCASARSSVRPILDLTSIPAEKSGPLALITITLTESSALRRARHSSSSARNWLPRALRFSARFSVSVATASFCS